MNEGAVLVTGVGGMIGAAVLRQLVADGIRGRGRRSSAAVRIWISTDCPVPFLAHDLPDPQPMARSDPALRHPSCRARRRDLGTDAAQGQSEPRVRDQSFGPGWSPRGRAHPSPRTDRLVFVDRGLWQSAGPDACRRRHAASARHGIRRHQGRRRGPDPCLSRRARGRCRCAPRRFLLRRRPDDILHDPHADRGRLDGPRQPHPPGGRSHAPACLHRRCRRRGSRGPRCSCIARSAPTISAQAGHRASRKSSNKYEQPFRRRRPSWIHRALPGTRSASGRLSSMRPGAISASRLRRRSRTVRPPRATG